MLGNRQPFEPADEGALPELRRQCLHEKLMALLLRLFRRLDALALLAVILDIDELRMRLRALRLHGLDRIAHRCMKEEPPARHEPEQDEQCQPELVAFRHRLRAPQNA